MCSSDFTPKLTWSCLDMPDASDHYPITHFKSLVDPPQIKNADWTLFRSELVQFSELFQESSNTEVAQIECPFRKATNNSIPRVKMSPFLQVLEKFQKASLPAERNCVQRSISHGQERARDRQNTNLD